MRRAPVRRPLRGGSSSLTAPVSGPQASNPCTRTVVDSKPDFACDAARRTLHRGGRRGLRGGRWGTRAPRQGLRTYKKKEEKGGAGPTPLHRFPHPEAGGSVWVGATSASRRARPTTSRGRRSGRDPPLSTPPPHAPPRPGDRGPRPPRPCARRGRGGPPAHPRCADGGLGFFLFYPLCCVVADGAALPVPPPCEKTTCTPHPQLVS